ncbi:MAG: hypothetical protein ACOYKE_13170 [Ferruginibacter sp.]
MEELTTEQIEAKLSKSIEKNKAAINQHILKLQARYDQAEGSEKIRLQTLIDRHTAYKQELDATVINDLVQTSLSKQTERLNKLNLKTQPDISKSKLPK